MILIILYINIIFCEIHECLKSSYTGVVVLPRGDLTNLIFSASTAALLKHGVHDSDPSLGFTSRL